jgi:hypothetical protein
MPARIQAPLSVLLLLPACCLHADNVPTEPPVHAEVRKTLLRQFHYQLPEADTKGPLAPEIDAAGVLRMKPFTVLSTRLNQSLSDDFEKEQYDKDARSLIWQNGGNVLKHVSKDVTSEVNFSYKNDVGRMGNIELFKLSW